jgi:cytosine deaminase
MYDITVAEHEFFSVRRWSDGPVSSLVIEDGRIKEWAADHRPGAELEFDGSLAVPGLVDIHAHLDKAALAERFPNVTGTIDEARTRMRDAKSSITRDDVADRAEGVLRALIVNGVTAIRSHVDIDPLIGLRGVEALLELRERYSGSVDIQLVAFPQEGAAGQPITAELMREALEMGVDVVGGHLSVAPTPELMERELDVVFSLAAKYDRPIDVHTDFGLDFELLRTRHADGRYYPDGLGAVHLAERTIDEGFQGRVTASHVCGLDSIAPEERSNVIDLLARAQVSVVALPSSNLYAHGRTDTTGARRGIAPIRELLRGGVRVAVGTDNIRDPFNPYVGPDLIANCVLTAITCQWVTTDDLVTVVGLHTDAAAAIMELADYGLDPGCRADLAVLQARSVAELLDGSGLAVAVLKGGRLVARSELTRTFTL